MFSVCEIHKTKQLQYNNYYCEIIENKIEIKACISHRLPFSFSSLSSFLCSLLPPQLSYPSPFHIHLS